MFQFEEIEKNKMPGVSLIKMHSFQDARGVIGKPFEKDTFEEAGISFNLEETLLISSKKGVFRGIHYQAVKPQPRIFSCVGGEVFCVLVNIMKGDFFGQICTITLSESEPTELYVPGGYAFGSLAMKDAKLLCLCGEKFYPAYGRGIRWNDSLIHIEWPPELLPDMQVSEKDKNLPSLSELEFAK